MEFAYKPLDHREAYTMNSIAEIFENSKHLLDSVDSFLDKYESDVDGSAAADRHNCLVRGGLYEAFSWFVRS